MKERFIALIRWATDFGVQHFPDRREQQRLRITNGISVGFIAMIAPYIPIYAFFGLPSLATTVALLTSFYFVILYFNHRGWFTRARILMFSTGGLAVFYFGQVLGPGVGTEMYCFSSAALPFLVSSTRERGVLAYGVLLPVAVFGMLVWSNFSMLGPSLLPEGIAPILYVLNVLTCFSMQTMEVAFFAWTSDQAAVAEARASQGMRRVLDNVEQGLVTVGREGIVGEQRSAALDRWLGAPAPGQTVWDWLAGKAPETADWLSLGWDDITDGMMPVDVCLEQLPKRVALDERTLSVSYQPIGGDPDGEGWEEMLVVFTDISAQLEAEEAEEAQRETIAALDRALSDRASFLEFFSETGAIVERVAQGGQESDVAWRDVHTIKGNTALYGLTSISRCCHTLENEMAEQGTAPTAAQREGLKARWEALRERLSFLLDAGGADRIEVDRDSLDKMVAALHARGEQRLAARLAAWTLQPAEVRLRRLGEQAADLARRLGKGDLEIELHDAGIRLPADGWGSFWSTIAHAARNAVDHGLESPEQRAAQGKPPARLRLVASPTAGGHICIQIEDNGQGVRWEAVRERAAARGLPAATEEDLKEALFADGFSTREDVTDVSGRGVGLAALRHAVEALGGQILLHSRLGEGTTMSFVLPASGAFIPEVEAAAAK